MNAQMSPDTQKIYHDYRAAIRLMRKSANGGGRTSERKQRALKSMADKYGIRISEVKQIVRDHDEINGIIHEHPIPYRREIEIARLFAERVVANGGTEYGDKCVACGTEDKSQVIRIRLQEDKLARYGVIDFTDPKCFPCHHEVIMDEELDRELGR